MLTALLTDLFRIDKPHQAALKKLKLSTVGDLLYHFPVRYNDSAKTSLITGLSHNEPATIYGTLNGLKARKTWKSKVPMTEGTIEDASGKIKAVWFHQPYIAKMYNDGDYVEATGTISERSGKLTLMNPRLEKLTHIPETTNIPGTLGFDESIIKENLIPIYRESKGVSSLWISSTIRKILSQPDFHITDPIPTELLDTYNLPDLRSALVWLHAPKKTTDYKAARKRLAFDEIFLIQLKQQQERSKRVQAKSFTLTKDRSDLDAFIDRWPFDPTEAQDKALTSVLRDMSSPGAMTRLLEGDVGAGKTAVAAAAVYAVTTTAPGNNQHANLQTAYMAPTEILARQQFENFIHFFDHLNIEIGLVTGSGCMKYPSKVDPTKAAKVSKPQLLKWIAAGQIPIVVGTHALIQKSVDFKNLGLVVIDEQHRFGTAQRRKLVRKDDIQPHLLSMTATPIPRTLALTIYGDLDITVLDQMPLGRKRPITKLIASEQERDQMYSEAKERLSEGRQVYVICPRINEPDPSKETAIRAKAVVSEAERLQSKVFPDYRVAYLHGKQKPAEKEEIMRDFEDHRIDILVATSVVEVGVNVPNATCIIIEGAERFGLAQLHQLRGRVIRSNHQPYCYAATDSKSEKTKERLTALTEAKDGFELAEYDLTFRGSGDLGGQKQSGISDLAMEALKNIKLVEIAKEEARSYIQKDPELVQFPVLQSALEQKSLNIHLE